MWIADAHRDNGKRLVVRADEKLTVFAELESAVRACAGRITSDEKEIAVLGSLEEGCSVVLP